MTQIPIVTLTLNPALDMSTEVPHLVPDEKLRCADPVLDPGGGGLNVSRAVMALGGESLALVALGGLTGDRLAGLIRNEGVPFLAMTAPGETRQSLTVTEKATGRQYRFMLPGPKWAAADQERVFTLLRASARTGAFSVISGSQPPGVPTDFPARLARAMPGLMVIVVGARRQRGICGGTGGARRRKDGDFGPRRRWIGAGQRAGAAVLQCGQSAGGVDNWRWGQLCRGLCFGAGAGRGRDRGAGLGDGVRERGGDYACDRSVPAGGCDAALAAMPGEPVIGRV